MAQFAEFKFPVCPHGTRCQVCAHELYVQIEERLRSYKASDVIRWMDAQGATKVPAPEFTKHKQICLNKPSPHGPEGSYTPVDPTAPRYEPARVKLPPRTPKVKQLPPPVEYMDLSELPEPTTEQIKAVAKKAWYYTVEMGKEVSPVPMQQLTSVLLAAMKTDDTKQAKEDDKKKDMTDILVDEALSQLED